MPEKKYVRLGFVPLTDCLPLVVARELGYFADEGLEVELQRETSWATLRDRVLVGQLDGAQMLAPMLLSASLGLCGIRKQMVTAWSLGLNGNAITVSPSLFCGLAALAQENSPVGAVQALKRVIESRRRNAQPQLVLAIVFPFSCHAYLLRYWLAVGGIDPDKDVKIVVLPPSQMVDHLRMGHIDGFCVGEPWNSVAALTGVGHCIVSGYDIWQNAPEKVLGMSQDWVVQHPQTMSGLLRALYRAGKFVDDNLNEAVTMLTEGHYIDLPAELLNVSLNGRLAGGLTGAPFPAHHFHVFSRYGANFPWRSHAQFLLGQMTRWGQLRGDNLNPIVAQCYRTDLYRSAMRGIISLPIEDVKQEGLHADKWSMPGDPEAVSMGPDLMVDGNIFVP